jgi:hypothetical protein
MRSRTRRRLKLAVLLVLALSAGVCALGGALVAASWVEAKRDENAQVECLSQPGVSGPIEVEIRDGEYFCTYGERSRGQRKSVHVETGIGTADAVIIETFVAVVAAFFGAVAALLACGTLALLFYVGRHASRTPAH